MVSKNFQNMFFVFETNINGKHSGSVGEFALKYRGAKNQSIGFQGQSYSIPLRDKNFNPLSALEIKRNIEFFINFAKRNPQMIFQITKLGKNLNGYNEDYFSTFFKDAPKNCLISGSWLKYNNPNLNRIIVNINNSIKDNNYIENKINHLIKNIKNPIIAHNNTNLIINNFSKKYNYNEAIFPLELKKYSSDLYAKLSNIHDLTWYGTHLINIDIDNEKNLFSNKLIDFSNKNNLKIRNIDYSKK